MSEATIRKATKSDLNGILKLYAVPEMDAADVLDAAEAETIFERMERYPDYGLYIAERHGKIIGSFSLLIMDKLAHRGARVGILEDLVVDPRWRGHSIGKQMMRLAMERCAESGCYKLMLSSNLRRRSAHMFYKSLGFRQHGLSFLVEFGT